MKSLKEFKYDINKTDNEHNFYIRIKNYIEGYYETIETLLENVLNSDVKREFNSYHFIIDKIDEFEFPDGTSKTVVTNCNFRMIDRSRYIESDIVIDFTEKNNEYDIKARFFVSIDRESLIVYVFTDFFEYNTDFHVNLTYRITNECMRKSYLLEIIEDLYDMMKSDIP